MSAVVKPTTVKHPKMLENQPLMSEVPIAELERIAVQVRRDILDMIFEAQAGHQECRLVAGFAVQCDGVALDEAAASEALVDESQLCGTEAVQ